MGVSGFSLKADLPTHRAGLSPMRSSYLPKQSSKSGRLSSWLSEMRRWRGRLKTSYLWWRCGLPLSAAAETHIAHATAADSRLACHAWWLLSTITQHNYNTAPHRCRAEHAEHSTTPVVIHMLSGQVAAPELNEAVQLPQHELSLTSHALASTPWALRLPEHHCSTLRACIVNALGLLGAGRPA
jgi:hypothetical protein